MRWDFYLHRTVIDAASIPFFDMTRYCRTMPRSTENVCLTLRPATVEAVDAAAQRAKRSRSQFIDITLEHALSINGQCGHAEAFADAQPSKLKRTSSK
jgi:hypothetical protein